MSDGQRSAELSHTLKTGGSSSATPKFRQHRLLNFIANFAIFTVFMRYCGKNVYHNMVFGMLHIFVKQILSGLCNSVYIIKMKIYILSVNW